MTSALREVASARSVTSRRLPSGVATTYDDPGSARNGGIAAGASDDASGVPFCVTVLLSLPRLPMPTSRAARALAGVLLALAAALCGAQSPPTSDPRVDPAPSTFGPPRPGSSTARLDIALV